MDNFKVIYKILRYLERCMDNEIYDGGPISPERLRISPERWEALMYMLQSDGYITGLVFTKDPDSNRPVLCEPAIPAITLKGLEYLAENGMMKKAENLLKGIKEIVPGI